MALLSQLLFVLLFGIVLVSAENRNRNNSASATFDKLMDYYNKAEPPSPDQSTQVKVGIYVNSFSINEQTSEYTVNIYQRQSWKDPRLAFTPPDDKTTKIIVSPDRVKDVWLPDTFCRNEQTPPAVSNDLLRVSSNGDMWYVTKRTATFSCPMKYQRYPFDTQMCPMIFESFAHTTDTLNLTWLDSPVDVDGGLQLTQWTLANIILYDCTQTYSAGTFPCHEIRFVLSREGFYFTRQVFLPYVFMVFLSWVVFWIHIEAMTARVLLGLASVLVIGAKSTMVTASLPPVSYLKAIDVWMGMCFIFALLSLLETVLVCVVSRKKGTGSELLSTFRKLFTRCSKTNIEEKEAEAKGETEADEPKEMQKARKIDMVSSVVFPLLFLLFNIIFWGVYSA